MQETPGETALFLRKSAPDLSSLHALLDEYRSVLDIENSDDHRLISHVIEASKRLRHISLLLTDIETLSPNFGRTNWDKLRNTPSLEEKLQLLATINENATRLELATESVYYNAARFATLCCLLAGEKKDPNKLCKGVVHARNNLIEHSEGVNGVLLDSFTIRRAGPVLKPIIPSDPKYHVDPGLYPNIQEFKRNCVRYLKRAIKELKARRAKS